MLKRCLLAVIVALLVTSSQIAAAEDYDWSQAKRIGTKAEFASYIESERRKGNTTFRVVLTNGLKVDTHEDFAKLSPANILVSIKGTFQGSGATRIAQVIYEIVEYPGTHVANAYLSSNQQQAWMNLSAEEKDLYNIAVGIVDEANKLSSEREKARYIHDAICERVISYERDKNTAIDALVYRKADCDGFMDAFYMLGRMCNLNVGRIFGFVDGGGLHGWNWITFSDGKTYCVDVTIDNTYNSREWFLAPLEVMKRHHSCEWEIIPNLQ